MLQFDQEAFIRFHVTRRPESFFAEDLENYQTRLVKGIAGKSVLVIGGAGTIGSSFIKALLPYRPAELVVVDYSENGLTELTRDLRSAYNHHLPSRYLTYPFDFGSEVFAKMFRQNEFDIVACFAAHKHVRSEKDHLAIEAMVRNNVFNTAKLLELAAERPPEHFFCVSTDKAANPVNVMGASKKLMERVLMSYTDRFKISTARFANVAFSNGSLLYGFIHRIMKRQPLSSPSDVRRYFVSPIESGQLCLLACITGQTRDIFFPKLREEQMLTFSYIAEQFLEAIGLKPDYCETDNEARAKAAAWTPDNKFYPVYFFKTNTSGEKKYEEFYTEEDRVNLGRFEALGVIENDRLPESGTTERILREFDRMFASEGVDKAAVVALLSEHLSDFRHIETGKSLDNQL